MRDKTTLDFTRYQNNYNIESFRAYKCYEIYFNLVEEKLIRYAKNLSFMTLFPRRKALLPSVKIAVIIFFAEHTKMTFSKDI
jgi:hypothetical protein